MEEKFLCVMATFDEGTNERFKLIKSKLKDNNIDSLTIPPHITLGAYVGVEENELCDWLNMLCSTNEKLKVNFNHFGLFSLNVSFLAPQASKELINFHGKLHERYEDCCGEIGYDYTVKSNNWVPHATILINEPEVILKALPIINENFKPFTGQIVSLSLCEFYPMREIKSFSLR